jgi:hypothetical protein
MLPAFVLATPTLMTHGQLLPLQLATMLTLLRLVDNAANLCSGYSHPDDTCSYHLSWQQC